MNVYLRDFLHVEGLATLHAAWPRDVVARAVAHHIGISLRANPNTGVTRNRYGVDARFIDWRAEDAERCKADPEVLFQAFFRGSIANSCSRITRGLAP